jgi:predicted kinase
MKKMEIKGPSVTLLIGHPLCGKSTWIRQSGSSAAVVSRDALVLEAYGSDDYDAAFGSVDQKKVDEMLKQRLKECASAGIDCIVDMTNMTAKRRKHTLSFFGKEYTKIAVVFEPLDMDEIKRRDDKRKAEENKSIPLGVIESMIKSYQTPTKEEGFHKITYINR